MTWRSENMLDMDGWPHRETNEAVIVWMRGTGSVTQRVPVRVRITPIAGKKKGTVKR